MKKLVVFSLIAVLLTACSSKEVNFTLTGNIKGLKKGKLYLQKIEDTLIVNVDSVEINGDSDYLLETHLKEPEILFLYLDKVDGDKNDDIIEFFAEEGEMTINTSLKNFTYDAEVKGSANQQKLEEFKGIVKRFNNQHLDLIKENFEAQQKEDEEGLIAVNNKYENLLRRKYLYTVNFAMNHKNLEVSPYVMLTEAFDANTKYLDTVYNSLEKNIRKSKYGKELKTLIKQREKTEKLEEKVEKEN
ncbi:MULTISPECIES: DUF4369 domain-containing protein [Mesonia]|uniref:Uncharacterized protein n=1 Tax=Mesonia oceanica TaxID=2687242 RepID=A0AC61YAM9_9FLAO|nr:MULTISPECIES: DUF4369 domain-containing protein [Mesonia]MAN26509.1 hypothetical protein [Mesonia sp.]MAQ41172.1 hypothetical protein [Mesonia sp.]MBJ98128.1 hypothetical protein [Flavobacteriaceae bacterium]VVV01270.1 hypothetical protein FVB9532_02560 [Mesonia oceanica]|tara:strand:- start:13453 stop:14187 length:735 start_codon:yes stop_codon:yes gene_type:complete